ncbi:hypothetical protein V5O48_007366, partial [Marasmius crinis-equi]
YSTRRDDRTEGSLLALTGEARTKRRRVWARGLANDALSEYEGAIRPQVNKLFERLSEQTYRDIDIGEWLNYFSFDFIVEVAFGGGSYMLSKGDKTELWEAMDNFAFGIEFLSHIPWLLNFFRDLPLPKPALRIRNLGIQLATNRMKQGARRKDLWYHLMDEAGMEKEKPSHGAVSSDGVLAIMAGSDTTSTALRNFFYLILAHPECYKQLQAEIDSVYPPEADAMDSSKHGSLQYLNACIFVAEGTQIHVPHYVVQRSAENFYLPDDFLPPRWLGVNVPSKETFLPFSYGPENCIGKHLARRVMMMVICLLMQNLEFKFADNFDWESWQGKIKDYFVCSREPLNVVITPRS